MSTTEELAGRVLPAAFAAQADTCVDPRDVLTAVRGRARRQRAAGPALMVSAVAGAVAAIVVGISAAVVNLAGNHAPSDQQVAAASGTHPGLDQLSGTCLDMARVNALWESDAGFGGVGSGDGCSQEADAIQATHPEVTSTVTAGNRTVYLAKAPAGIRAGFIALTPTESAAAIKANGKPDTPYSPQYLIVAIPDDNPQDVLVSILKLYPLPAN